MYVSYERCGLRTDEADKVFNEGGGFLTTDNGKGITTYKRYAKGSAMFLNQTPDFMETFSKSLNAPIFKLMTSSEKANIVITFVKKPYVFHRSLCTAPSYWQSTRFSVHPAVYGRSHSTSQRLLC